MGECKEIVLVVFVGLNMVLGGVGAGAARVAREVSSPPEAFSTGEHDLRAYACRKDVGEWVESNQSTVSFEGCTDSGRKHVAAKVAPTGGCLVAITADIETRWGKLCCECDGGNAFAFSTAWITMEETDLPNTKWAQTGYIKSREGGATTIRQGVFYELIGEVGGDRVWHFDYHASAIPAEGSTHNYRAELDATTGTWSFCYDGSFWLGIQDDGWQGSICPWFTVWAGEVVNEEDEMPGSLSNRCSFTGCQYKFSVGDWKAAGFVNGEYMKGTGSYYTDDPNKWDWDHVSTTAFDIWDEDTKACP